jgi:nucleoside-diphosphate-sugar epimerase
MASWTAARLREELVSRAMRILLCGGAGYVGSVLAPKLCEAGHQVRVVDLMVFGRSTLPVRPALSVVEGDVNDEALMRKEMKGVDAIINLAFITQSTLQPQLSAIYPQTNYAAPVKLAERAVESGVRRYIFASSTSVYGSRCSGEVIDEGSATQPVDEYGRSKMHSESALLAMCSDFFSVTVVRPSTACGYSPRQRFDLLINRMVNEAYHHREIEVLDGYRIRPMVHIDDLADAYVRLVDASGASIHGQVFNISYENATVLQIAQQVCAATGGEVIWRDRESLDSRSYQVSSEKLRRALGFVPRRTSRDAIEHLVQKLKQNAFTDPLRNPNYFNRVPK